MPTAGKLNALAQDKVTHGSFEYEGEAVKFAFAGGRLTGADIQQFKEADETEQAGLLTALLARVVVSWDITHEDGSEFPPTVENLNTLPLNFQVQLLQAFQKAATASGEAGGSFAGG